MFTSDTGTYNLPGDFTATGNNEIEPNNTRAEAPLLISGQTVKGFINHQDRVDMFQIELTQSRRLSVNFNSGQ